MLKIYKGIKKNNLLLLIGISLTLLCCNDRCLGESGPGEKGKSGRIIILVEDFGGPESFDKFSTYIKQSAKRLGSSKELTFAHIESIRSKEDYLRELASMHNRAENLNRYILEEVDKQGWDKQQDEFVLLGYSEGGVTVLESAEELQKKINLTKVVVISAPLDGYDFHHASYELSHGAIGQLITGMRQATSGRNSTIIEELTPGSNYLKQRHAFIESQTGEKDLKFYVAASSIYNLCFSGESSSNEGRAKQLDQEVQELFDEVAKEIRAKYKQTESSKNPNDLPGVEDYMRLQRFLEKTDRQGFYTYYKHLNGGKDHNGKISVETQLANNITNPRMRRCVFDSYSGTLFTPYKELKDLKPINLFDKQTTEFTPNNIQLYNALLSFILDNP